MNKIADESLSFNTAKRRIPVMRSSATSIMVLR